MTDVLLAGAVIVGIAVVALIGVVSLEVLLRRPEVGVALVLGVTLLQAALAPGGPGVKFFFDIVFALLLAAGIARFLRFRRLTALECVLMLLGFMLLLSLVRGVLVFGQHSWSEYRRFAPLISTAIYFSSFPPSRVRNDRIGRIWLALTIPMVVLIALRWVQNLGSVNLGVPVEVFGADAALRVVNGPYGFFLATSVMLTVPFWQQRDQLSRKLTWIGGLLLVVAVLLNRRTVWVTLLVGVVVVLLRSRKLGHRAMLMVIAAAVVAVAVFVALPVSGPETAGGTQPNINSPLTTGTFEWRTEGWSTLLAGWSGSPLNWIIGEPFGSGFARDISGHLVASTTDPHNFYIMTLLRTGVIGMLALVILAACLLRALWRQGSDPSTSLLAPGIFPALLVTQLVWFLAWEPGNEVGIIIGLALALASSRFRGSYDLGSPTPRRAAPPAGTPQPLPCRQTPTPGQGDRRALSLDPPTDCGVDRVSE
jgi:hypothetical protein